MSIRKLTDDLNIISSLPNRPTQTSEELKAKFDEAGNIIKNYINGILLLDIESEVETQITEGLYSVNNTITSLKEEVTQTVSDLESTIDTLETKLADSDTAIKTQLKDFIKYQNFSASFAIDGFSGQTKSMGTLSIPSGYSFLGLVGNTTGNPNFVSSFLLSGSTVHGSVHNLGTASTATVSCRAMFVKNNIS